jgi:alkylation response protein AidB-like acyl-CoA dehydrogenase
VVDIEAARLMIYYAAWLLDQGLSCNLQAATAKYHVTEAAINATEDATRIFGAYGMSMEMSPQRYFRDARWFLYGAGTQTINLDIIASEVSG